MHFVCECLSWTPLVAFFMLYIQIESCGSVSVRKLYFYMEVSFDCTCRNVETQLYVWHSLYSNTTHMSYSFYNKLILGVKHIYAPSLSDRRTFAPCYTTLYRKVSPAS
jgi:hypothetical protein